jgi:cysteine desulfurase
LNLSAIMPNDPIYLDYNATTPCDPRVVDKMLPYFSQWYGNPATGLHIQGRKAAKAVDHARDQISALLNVRPGELVFTAGATESNNLAILGLARMARDGKRKQIVTSAIEHKAVLLPCKKLEKEGFTVTVLPVDSTGRVSVEAANAAITEQTLLVSLQIANNEIGTLQPIKAITELAHERGVFVHSDAAQAVGKIATDVAALDVDMLSLSAHKLYGPKGSGALYIRGGSHAIPLEPLLYGGGQESNIRSGTSNVSAIVGFGEACQLAAESVPTEVTRLTTLRDQFEAALLQSVPNLKINGYRAPRLPNTSSLVFPNIDADALLLNLPDVMMGTGSACNSGAIEPSHVLLALGLTREEATSTIRASLGRFTTTDNITMAVVQIKQSLECLT